MTRPWTTNVAVVLGFVWYRSEVGIWRQAFSCLHRRGGTLCLAAGPSGSSQSQLGADFPELHWDGPTVLMTVLRSQIVVPRLFSRIFYIRRASILQFGPANAVACQTGMSVSVTVSALDDRAKTPSRQGFSLTIDNRVGVGVLKIPF
jgi:hypothetical protein